ncbi:MAG TPA: tetratricopeptide repeat protein [Acetobacteraceae bacterium]|nr:tetratricopeptide repeat protein [Acetobacteraceae bacterium]
MRHLRNLGLGSLIALSVLSACAAADPPAAASAGAGAVPLRDYTPSGVYADFLAGRFALAQSEPAAAADAFLKALAAQPNDPALVRQAFFAAVLSGRAAAAELALRLPDDPVAQLVLVGQDVRAGNWGQAEQRCEHLPEQGLPQLLRPLLIAWTQAGGGDASAALATLRPLADGRGSPGIFALHAGMIADLAGLRNEAAHAYGVSQTDMPQMNLRMAQVLASWDARTNHPAAAQHVLAALVEGAPDMAIALPALEAASGVRVVGDAPAGMAEAYLSLAGALRAQASDDYAMIMLRLALDLRPDLTAARIMAADILSGERRDAAALRMLAPVAQGDTLAALADMRRINILLQMGQRNAAMEGVNRLVVAYPDSPLPLIQRGDVLRQTEQFKAAIAAYSAGIARLAHPGADDWPVFYDRGIAFEQVHDSRSAEADFRTALRLAPDQPYVLNYLGYTWANKGEHLTEALHMIQSASEKRPNDGAITDSLGWVLLHQGHVAEAVQVLQRAVEQDPEDPTINGHLGDAYKQAGRLLEAQYQWRRALTLNPGPEDVAKLESKLQTPATASVASGRQ